MATDEGPDALLHGLLDAARSGRKGRSRLYRYMQRHFALLDAVDRPDWQAMAEFLEGRAKGGAKDIPTDAEGKVPSATVLRQTWWRVKRDAEKAGARRPRAAAETEPVFTRAELESSIGTKRRGRNDAAGDDGFGLSSGPLPPKTKEEDG